MSRPKKQDAMATLLRMYKLEMPRRYIKDGRRALILRLPLMKPEARKYMIGLIRKGMA